MRRATTMMTPAISVIVKPSPASAADGSRRDSGIVFRGEPITLRLSAKSASFAGRCRPQHDKLRRKRCQTRPQPVAARALIAEGRWRMRTARRSAIPKARLDRGRLWYGCRARSTRVAAEAIPLDIVCGRASRGAEQTGRARGASRAGRTGQDAGQRAAASLQGTALSGRGRPDPSGIVHRIDRDTSGLLVVAKDDGASGAGGAVQGARHGRRYLAVVQGAPDPAIPGAVWRAFHGSPAGAAHRGGVGRHPGDLNGGWRC